jgi:hypothetical protein
VVSSAPDYVGGIKIYSTGLQEDPVPGEKRGKGVPSLNSSYWLADLSVLLSKHTNVIQQLLSHAYEQSKVQPGYDFLFFINYANHLFMRAENRGMHYIKIPSSVPPYSLLNNYLLMYRFDDSSIARRFFVRFLLGYVCC